MAVMLKMIRLVLLCAFFLTACSSLESRRYLTQKEIPVREFPMEPELRLEIGMHTAPVTSIAVDDEGQYLVTGSLDKTIRVWNLMRGRKLEKVLRHPIGAGDEGKIYAVAMLPNGRTIASAGWTGMDWNGMNSIYIWDRTSGQIVRRIEGLPNVVHHLAYSRFGDFLVASLGGESGIRVYRTLDYGLVFQDRYYKGPCYGADFDIRGRLITASYDGFIRLYDRDFRLIAKKQAQSGRLPHSISFSTDGMQIAVGFSDISRVDVLHGESLEWQSSPDTKNTTTGCIPCVCWAADGTLYVGGNREKEKSFIYGWENDKKIDVPVSTSHLLSLVPLRDGCVAFAASDSFGTFKGDSIITLQTTSALNYRNGHKVFQVSNSGNTVQFFYEEEGNSLAQIIISSDGIHINPEKEGVRELTQNRSKEISQQKSSALFPALTEIPGVRLSSWKDHPQPQVNGIPIKLNQGDVSRSIAISSKGNCLALGSDCYIYLLDMQGNEIWKIPTSGTVHCVNISSNDEFIVAALGDGTIRWYKRQSGKEMMAFFPHQNRKNWIVWTSSGFYYCPEAVENIVLGQQKNRSKDSSAEFIPLSPNACQMKEVVKALSVQLPSDKIEQLQEKETQLTTADIRGKNSLEIAKSPTPETATSVSTEAPKNSLYLLAVGVNKYKASGFTSLNFAAKDASDFAEMMKSQQGIFYRNVESKVLKDEEATRDEILGGFEWLKTKMTGHLGDGNNIAMVFLSGHGINDAGGFYYFLPYSFRYDALKSTAVPFSSIQSVASSLSGRVIFFIDTCRSGNVMGKKQVDLSGVIRQFSLSESQIGILAASTGAQESLEKSELQNGVFTYSLLEGIHQGKAAYGEKYISLLKLASYLARRVPELTKNVQTPTISIPRSISDFNIAISLEKSNNGILAK